MTKTRIFNRFLKIASWTLLSLVLIIALIVSFALSSTGTKWAIDYVNEGGFGVNVDYKSGSLYSELQLKQVKLQQPGLDASLGDISLDLSLSCLFVGEVCINKLHLNKVNIALGDMPASVEEVEETKNKLIKLPILLSLNELKVGEILLSQHSFEMVRLNDLLLSLSFQDRLNITRLDFASLALNLPKATDVTKPVAPVTPKNEQRPREWLSALANYQYEVIKIPEVFIPIELALKNATLRNMCVKQQMGDDSFSTVLCTDILAFELGLKNQKLETTVVIDSLNQGPVEPAFAPTHLKLKASLNFAKNFEHNILLYALKKDTPISDLSPKPKALKIDTPIFNNGKGFELKNQGSLNKIDLALTHLPTQQKLLSINAAIDLASLNLPLKADIKLEELKPAVEDAIKAWLPSLTDADLAPLIGVSLLQARVDGDMQGYRFTSMLRSDEFMGVSDAEINALFKPMGRRLQARSLVDIQKLNLSGSIGNIDYTGKAKIAPNANNETELAFNGKLSLDSLKLSKVNPTLESLISGSVPHTILITETTQSGSVQGASLRGSWQNLPLSLVADAELEKSGNILVQGVRLTQGENNLNVQGNLYSSQALESMAEMGVNFPNQEKVSASSLDFKLNLEALSDIYPELQGQLFARGNASGSIEKPKIVIQANAKEVVVGGLRLEDALIDASVDMANKLSSKAQVSIVNLYTGGQNIPQLDLQISGDEDEQSLRLDIPEGEYITQQYFKGKLNADNTGWSGKWLQGSIVSSFAELSLQSEPEVAINLQPFSLQLEQHCWEGRSDKLCIGNVNATQEAAKTKLSLDYNVMNAGIAQLLPTFDIEQSSLDLNADIDVDWQQIQGLNFSADISAANATLVSNDSKVNIENIQAKVQGTPKSIESSFSFDSTEAGTVSLNSQLDLSNQPYQHQGKLVISDFAVSYFASFITEVKKLNGDINADITFEGPVDKPALQGELTLADGAVILKAYPLRLADYNQKVVFNGSKADFSGQFRLGEGRGSIDGDLDFSDALLVNLQVLGDKLDIAYETYKFQVSPDLKINLRPDLLSVAGDVEVPYARIKIKSLPPSAKTPTQDIIVVDEKKVANQSSIPLDVNVNILIDKAKKGEVKLDALDLKAELSGDLNVQLDAKNTRVNGIVQVLKGDYEAYSQVLQIRKGDISFSGQPDVPAFDIEAIRNPLNTKDDVVAGIRVTGNAIKPRVELFSEPSMEQARQLSYLISGADNFGAGGESSDSNTTLVNALVSYGVGRSENGIGSLGQKLGVKDLNIQTAGQGGDTQVQLSGQLAEGVKITYGIGVFDSVSEVSVHYQLLPQLYLEAVSGVNNTLDLYYQITSKD
ncbi:translocation/assembly module TamB domain-containing protein [Glaciecola sp. MF2-115]|uniref:translocation/assembly module TamB domain-containing protein n=1 Tax=Glaciecola sp. MF2-115 TaxID=3384827 RepID=UPI0039A03AFD